MKRKFLWVAITVTLLVTYKVYPIIAIKKQVGDLSRLLSDVSLNVRLSGADYQINHGRVEGNVSDKVKLKILSLAAFYQWNKEDPLFDSPDLDPDGLAKSVDNIQNDQSELLKILDTNQEIYPIKLLKEIADSAQLDRQFLASPSDQLANHLIQKQLETAGLYADSAVNLRSNITPIENKPVSFNIQLSTAVARDDLQIISDNARSLQSEIIARSNCLINNTGCERPYLKLPKSLNIVGQTSPQPKLLSKDLIFKGIGDGRFPIDGPYRANTDCFGWGQDFTKPEHFFYIGFPTQGQGYIEPLLATDTFFRKIPPNSSIQIENRLYQNGQHYIIQRPNAYICPDTGHLNELGEVDWFLKHNHPILGNIDVNDRIFPEAQNAEKSFFNASYPSYNQLENLANYYGYLYERIVKSRPDDPLKDQLLNRYLSAKNKLAYFNLFLNHEGYILDYYLQVARLDPGTYNLNQFLYPFVSDYSLTYLTFSPSVWRSNAMPQYIVKTQVKNAISLSGGYISYQQAITNFSPDEINSWFGKADLSLGIDKR